MVFVPEGQPDSSQAQSAWVETQRGSPGYLFSVIYQFVLVVETEPRHEQATARRMLIPLQSFRNARYSC
jgi:hypothetical protein